VPSVERVATNQHPLEIRRWCGPTRVKVVLRSSRSYPNNLDAGGRALFCQLKLPTSAKGAPGEGPRRIKDSADYQAWCDGGTFLLRNGGSLALNGGNGSYFFDVYAEQERVIDLRPEWVWLTTCHTSRRTVGEWPPGATRFRLLSGTAEVGGPSFVPVPLGVDLPIEALGDGDGVLLIGTYQTGSLLI